MGRPASTLPRITFRLTPDLQSKLEASATENGRSLNAELVERLEQSFTASDTEDGFDVRQEVKRHHSWMVMMMQTLASSKEKSFDPIRDLLASMDEEGKAAAAKWFLENEKPE